MRPSDINRILDFRFESFIDKYWCFSFDEEKGLLFMYVADNYVGVKKMRKRMSTIASYLLRQFAQVNAVIFPDTTYTRKEDKIVIKNQTVMIEKKETGNWLPVVKETVDSVYQYLIQHPDGISMSAKDYGKRGARVCSELVSRGIIEKKRATKGRGCIYRWAATMGPTKVLYGSIAQKLYDEVQRYKDTYIAKRRAQKKKAAEEQAAAVQVNEPETMETFDAVQVPALAPAPTLDDVKAAWEKLIAKYEDRPRLQNAMRYSNLLVIEFGPRPIVVFTVVNRALKEWIMEHLIGELQADFRDAISNENVNLLASEYVAPIIVGSAPAKPATADDFSVQENWEAMKRKGVTIEDNQLVMTEVKVIKTVLS